MYSKASIYTHRRRNRKKALISFAVILLVSVLAALGTAIYWEKVQQQKKNELMMQAEIDTDLPKETPTQQVPEPEPETEQAAALAGDKQDEAQQPSPEEQTQPAEPEKPETKEEVPADNAEHAALVTSERIRNSKALVPYSGTRVEDDYFDDVAFVGDSITEGIKLYDLMSNSTVVAARGINLDSVFTDDKIRTAEGNTTVMKALSAANPHKIYIMFGANGVGWYTEEHFNQVYTKFVQAVEEQHPDSQIFLQSILPVTQKFDDARDDISNEKINKYNEIIVGIAETEGVHYLDVASVFKDDKGCLPEDSNGDGMHFGGVYYQKWFDYLRTHTVSETEEEPKPEEQADAEKPEEKKEPEAASKEEAEKEPEAAPKEETEKEPETEKKESVSHEDSQRDPERKPKVKSKKESKD